MEKERELTAKRKHSIDANSSGEVLKQKKRKLAQEELESEEENQVSFILSQIQDPVEEEKATISPLPKAKEKKKPQSPNISKILHYSPKPRSLHSSPKSPKSPKSPTSLKTNYRPPNSLSPVIPFSPQRSFFTQSEDDSMVIPSKKRLKKGKFKS